MKDTITAEEFASAYDRYSDHIFRHCYFRVYHRERAQELMQETFLHAWEYATRGNTIDNIRALLYKIANNLVIDESRKKKELSIEGLMEESREQAGSLNSGSKFEPSVDDRETLYRAIDGRKILDTLHQLEPQDRDVIVMRYVDGMRPKDIAVIMKESVTSISVRLHRAVKKLRAIIPSETTL